MLREVVCGPNSEMINKENQDSLRNILLQVYFFYYTVWSKQLAKHHQWPPFLASHCGQDSELTLEDQNLVPTPSVNSAVRIAEFLQ